MTAHPVRVASAARQVRSTKRRLLWSCAAAAIIVTAGTTAQKARAQAFAGTPTLPNPNIAVSGSATRTITGGTTETITVGSPTATINWIPSDNDGAGTIDFLPNGNVATFINDPNTTADYTVLNRILPAQTRPIGLNGTIISQLQDLSENVSTGGHVWFYSPNGIIVGATAVFDVGSLLLTVNDPVSFGTTANGFTGHFVANTDSTASVTIDPGAKISASPENSYVALVAPRVVQGGEVGVNGSAAYVAGEDVTLTMNQGLFDIQVDVGTSDPFSTDGPNGIVHTGTTGGPASTGAGDNHRIYMVAVPKNQALTMLLSGNAGFAPAGAAQVVNGEIVLSAGWSIFDTSGSRGVSTPISSDASIQIDPGTYTSNVFGIARGDITAIADTGSISFLGGVNLNTYDAGDTGNVILGAEADNSLTVGGSVLMNSSNPANPSEVKLYADDFGIVDITGTVTMAAQASVGQGGDATISADNDGQIDIGGTAYVVVSGEYFSAADAGLEQFAGSASGGSINVTAFNDGLITAGGMNLTAKGTGQDSLGGDAGGGVGGNITVYADSGGDIQVNGTLNAIASGYGGDIFNGTFGSGTFAGYGNGGSINVHVGDGTIGVTGDAYLEAGGTGGTIGDSGSGASQYGGSGSGGYAYLYSDGPGTITVGGATTLGVQGFGGDGQNGGSGYGGFAGIYAFDGTIDLGPTIGMFAGGWGGDASFGFGGFGGYGSGGRAYIEALAIPPGVEFLGTFGTITADSAGYVLVDASGHGGRGGAGNSDNAAGAGGDGQGGVDCGECSGGAFVLAQVDGAQLSLGNVDVRAEGYGGFGGAGGAGQTGGTGGTGYGGLTQAGLTDDPNFPTGATTGSASFGNLTLSSNALGGNGGASLFEQGDGGSAFGGDAQFLSFASNATASSISLFAIGYGADGGLVGGDGYGGTITVTADGGHIDVTNALSALAQGFGGHANAAGTGGAAFGGDIDLTVNGGQISFTGGTLSTNAFGGLGYTGGDGFGGIINASITDLGGLLAMNGDVLLNANGTGGNGIDTPGGTGGTGGTGFGGDVTITTADTLIPPITSTLQFGNLSLRAHGNGGHGGAGTGGGVGGDAYGGSITTALGETTVTGGDFSIIANGNGGAGGAGTATGGVGGYGEGGVNSLTLGSAGSINAATYASLMDGLGGVGGAGGTAQGDGGDGQGGTNSATIDGDATFGGSVANFNGFIVTTYALGGDGLTGGSAQGGTSSILVNGSLHVIGQVQSTASAQGGNGGTNGGDAFGGGATVTVNGDLTAGRLSNLTNAFGGSGSAAGGFAQGGHSLFELPAGTGTATISSSTVVSASGTGGSSSAGTGGDGSGGDSHVKAHDGTHISAANLSLAADGFGGNGVNGGQGEGGFIEAIALQEGALLTLTGNAILSASGYGGTGTIAGTGGDGFGGTAGLYAGIDDNPDSPLVGGTVTVVNATVRSLGQGGDGGLGGDGSGGLAQVGTRYGTLTVTGTLFGDAGGGGGDSSAGTGGTGFGGTFQATANFFGDTGLATLNLATTDLFAVGVGGNGVGSGNAGGTGFGGLVQVLSPTAGSTLTATALSLHAGANGGVGGNGAVGGRGGDANGGHALVDIAAGNANLGVLGSFARGVAGNGGTGSSGAGGAGGDGFAGIVELNVTGNLTAASYQGDAQANGGGGGAGTTLGAGGSAEGGSTYLNVYIGGHATITGATILDATALRGNGSTLGTAIGGFANLQVSDTFGAGAFTARANGTDAGDILITVADGSSADLGVAQLIALGSLGTGSITIDLGGAPLAGGGGFLGGQGLNNILLTADSLNLLTSGDIDITSLGGASIDVAGLFHADAGGAMTLDDIDDTAVVRADVIDFHANSFSSTFDILGRDIGIFTVQDLDVTSTVLIADEILTLQSDNDVIAGDLDAGLQINLVAGHDITAGDLVSGGGVRAYAINDITLGDITAAGLVDLESDGTGGLGNIIFGDVNAGILDFTADGTVTGGDIVVVNKATGDAQGAIVLGDITVTGPEVDGDFSVGIGSETSIHVGNVSGTDRVGFATFGPLTTGNINAGSLFMALVSGDVTVGSVTTAPTGRVYIADSSMFIAAGGGTETDDFDVSLVLPLPPVPTGGSITFGGPVSTGRFQAAAGTDLFAGNITAGSSIEASAGSDLTTANLAAGTSINLNAGGNLSTGDILAGGNVDFGSGGNMVFGDAVVGALDFSADDGTVAGGDILAESEVVGNAGGAIVLGDITITGAPLPGDEFSVGLSSGTSITVDNVNGFDRVGFETIGDLSTGNIQAGSLFMALVGGDITVGSITTGASGQVYLADSSMFIAAGGCGCGETDDFDFSLVLPLAPVPTGGSITIAGPVSTGQFRAAAGDSLIAGNITAGSSIDASAGDNISTGNLAFGQSVTLNAGNNIVAADLDGGHNVALTAGNNLAVGDVDADGTATFTAIGLASFLGAVAVPTITVTSSDINVPFGGQLGVWGVTNLLTLNAVSGNPIIIGNSGALAAAAAIPQYVLHEDGDLSGTTIVINAVGANGGPDPDIIVHNVGIDGSLASNPSVSHIVLNTDASVLIDGQVLFSGASATDSLAINAGDSIQIDTTDGGGIAMVNAAEDRPSGLLTLTSDNIWAGSQSLLDQLGANVNFVGRDGLVGTNPGVEVPEGYLIAGGMTLSTADTLFVQNSGAGQAYAGITVGAGGLTIATTGAAPAQVVAYGRKMNPDGTFVTGNQFFALVNFTKATSHYTAQSEFNECLINTGCFGGGAVGGGTLGPEAILGPVDLMGNPEETIEWAASEDEGQAGSGGEVGEDGEEGGEGSVDWSSQLFGTGSQSDEALVDEGVTSGGDNNQWDSQVCKPTSSDQPCPEPAPPAAKQEQ